MRDSDAAKFASHFLISVVLKIPGFIRWSDDYDTFECCEIAYLFYLLL